MLCKLMDGNGQKCGESKPISFAINHALMLSQTNGCAIDPTLMRKITSFSANVKFIRQKEYTIFRLCKVENIMISPLIVFAKKSFNRCVCT